jgi:hypothetical protein
MRAAFATAHGQSMLFPSSDTRGGSFSNDPARRESSFDSGMSAMQGQADTLNDRLAAESMRRRRTHEIILIS